MENSIIINVHLAGALEGPVRSVDVQKNTILLTNPKTQLPMPYTKTITHTDRVMRQCSRVFNIPGTSVTSWVSSDCPSWERPNRWKTMSKKQKIQSYINSYDEGYGVTFEIIEDGDI